jgi:hypothetical protein
LPCRAALDDAVDLGWSGVSRRVRDSGRYDDGLARAGHGFLAVEGEVGLARRDGEAFLLAGMDVLGDHAAGRDGKRPVWPGSREARGHARSRRAEGAWRNLI